MVTTSTKGLTGEDDTAPHNDAPVSSEHVMDLLEEHVPISLLMDLVAPAGPDSRDILSAEGTSEQAWWEPST